MGPFPPPRKLSSGSKIGFGIDVCCNGLLRLINDPESPVVHWSELRNFLVRLSPFGYLESENELEIHYLLEYCPMCGKQFPADLDLFYDQIIKEEFKIAANDINTAKAAGKIPEEFFSEAWWIKRQDHKNFPHKSLNRLERLKKIIYEASFYTSAEKKIEYAEDIAIEQEIQETLDIICCVGLWSKTCSSHDCKNCVCNRPPESMVLYKPEIRAFYLLNIASRYLVDKNYSMKNKRLLSFQMQNCPWCGTKLPKSLAYEWFKIVTSEFGVTNIFNQKQLTKKLPPEFLTEEWWRERRL